MIKRGICYFVYAWGVPMVFTVASKIYANNLSAARINSTSQSRTAVAETCWFSNPVGMYCVVRDSIMSWKLITDVILVYGLITYPNVVLVVFNLIFFIPSACKLYASSKFLAKAENDLAKFETDRWVTLSIYLKSNFKWIQLTLSKLPLIKYSNWCLNWKVRNLPLPYWILSKNSSLRL